MNAPNHRGMRRIDSNGLGYHIFMYFFFFNKKKWNYTKKKSAYFLWSNLLKFNPLQCNFLIMCFSAWLRLPANG